VTAALTTAKTNGESSLLAEKLKHGQWRARARDAACMTAIVH
jgi:hypothetical protein